MFCRRVQGATYSVSFGIAGTNGIGTVGQPDRTVRTQVDDHFCLLHKAMYVARLVVLWIRDKQHADKANRCHVRRVSQSAWVVQASLFLGVTLLSLTGYNVNRIWS